MDFRKKLSYKTSRVFEKKCFFLLRSELSSISGLCRLAPVSHIFVSFHGNLHVLAFVISGSVVSVKTGIHVPYFPRFRQGSINLLEGI